MKDTKNQSIQYTMKKSIMNPAYSAPEMSLFRMDINALVCASPLPGEAGQNGEYIDYTEDL